MYGNRTLYERDLAPECTVFLADESMAYSWDHITFRWKVEGAAAHVGAHDAGHSRR
jgi:hypothetical protein